ncbi:Na+/H+ antiporter NhaC family protein [Alteribacillus bidgolensis]|uniref:Na+/H+ antiporter family protein n=1 Tax=Alteribacillus bidgolensis TaxID=930129 RepID=A0A1G8R7G0_9BACI|nr:Na+/H+ antiporter NhaC family protein [Alteribacillus bidgolensis]SDJ12926.1 Na+/H+ antiporter family protein [Alteribacillus bidgolensis]
MQMELWLSIAPPLVAVIFAMWTKQVIPSLLVGLWVGSWLYTGSLTESLNQTLVYITGVLTDIGNLDVLLFLYIFSGLVALIQAAGGVQAFAQWISTFIKGPNQTLLASWGLLPITFMDCGFRVVAGGAIIKPLAKRYGVARERLAYMLNNSSSPVIVLIPLATTFIGYIIGVLNKGMQAAGISGDPLALFIQSLPFHFFSYISILITLLSLIPAFNIGMMKQWIKGKQEETTKADIGNSGVFATEFSKEFEEGKRENTEKADSAKDQTGTAMKGEKKGKGMGMKMGMDNEKPELRPRLFNIFVPIILLIALSFFLMIGSEEPSRMMLQALIITLVVSILLFLVQGLSLKKMTDRFIKGGNKLMTTIIILLLAWPISDVSQDLGLTQLIETTLQGNISPIWVPFLVFVVTATVTYFIGSSWGAWALMMPVAIPLAVTTGSSIPLAAAAVFSGGTFGDVTSPVSGMTAMSAGIAEADHMKYVQAMAPYNITAAVVSSLLFLGVSFLII